jgi:hypothetical protein
MDRRAPDEQRVWPDHLLRHAAQHGRRGFRCLRSDGRRTGICLLRRSVGSVQLRPASLQPATTRRITRSCVYELRNSGQALDAEDDAYLRAESRLRDSGNAVPEPQLANPDRIGRLLAGTVLAAPPVGPVVDNLSATFGDRLAKFLVLRLVKVPTTTEWRARTTLTYLQRHPDPRGHRRTAALRRDRSPAAAGGGPWHCPWRVIQPRPARSPLSRLAWPGPARPSHRRWSS